MPTRAKLISQTIPYPVHVTCTFLANFWEYPHPSAKAKVRRLEFSAEGRTLTKRPTDIKCEKVEHTWTGCSLSN